MIGNLLSHIIHFQSEFNTKVALLENNIVPKMFTVKQLKTIITKAALSLKNVIFPIPITNIHKEIDGVFKLLTATHGINADEFLVSFPFVYNDDFTLFDLMQFPLKNELGNLMEVEIRPYIAIDERRQQYIIRETIEECTRWKNTLICPSDVVRTKFSELTCEFALMKNLEAQHSFCRYYMVDYPQSSYDRNLRGEWIIYFLKQRQRR